MQNKIYIELKQKQVNVMQLNFQLNYNYQNNINNDIVLIKLERANKELKTFKKEKHLL